MFLILVILILIRPFISSLAFPCLNITYSSILLIFLLVWIIFRGLPLKEIRSIQYPLIFFVLALVISIIFSSDKINSLYEGYKYVTAILLFLIVIPLSDNEKKGIINTIIIAGVIISILAIYQYFFGFKHLIDYVAKTNISSPFIQDYLNQRRVFSPFVTPNTLAGYLIIVIPLVLIIKNKEKWFILLLLSSVLFFTKSIGAFISLFLGIIFYLYLRKNLSAKKVLLAVVVAIGCVFVVILRQSAGSEHLMPAFSIFRRFDYWRDTLKIIKLHPFTGVGIGNFNLPLSSYAHNSYLQICAEMGIFGLISFLWLITGIFRPAIKNITSHQNVYFLTASAIFLIYNFVDFSFFLPEVSLLWWVILALSNNNVSKIT